MYKFSYIQLLFLLILYFLITIQAGNTNNPCKPDRCTTPRNTKPVLNFIHIAKTGGETIESILHIRKFHQNAYYRCFYYQNNLTFVYKAPCHRPTNEYTFGLVRNPYDRLFSWFHFCIHGYSYSRKSGQLDTPGPIPYNGCDILRAKILKDNHLFNNVTTITSTSTSTTSHHHNNYYNNNTDMNANTTEKINLINSQQYHRNMNYTKHLFEWYLMQTKNISNSLMPPPVGIQAEYYPFCIWSTYEFYFNDYISKVPLVDYVMRFEDIYQKNSNKTCLPFFNEFCKIGIKLDLPTMLPHENDDANGKITNYGEILNFMAHKPYYEFYTTRAKEMVETFYKHDLRKYNYTFKPVE